MLTYLVIGSSFAFAAAVQPGPLQAFLLSRVASTGWRRTLPAAFAPLLSDGPIALVALLVLGRLPELYQAALQSAGGAFLIYLSWVAYRQWRHPSQSVPDGAAPRTLLEAALVNLLNPNPYLGWALVLGPTFLSAWRQSPSYAAGLIIAFYGTMVAMLGGFIFLVGSARFLGPSAQRGLVGASALLLAGLGIFLIASAAFSGATRNRSLEQSPPSASRPAGPLSSSRGANTQIRNW